MRPDLGRVRGVRPRLRLGRARRARAPAARRLGHRRRRRRAGAAPAAHAGRASWTAARELFARRTPPTSPSTASSSDPQMPRIVLLIDNYPEFKSEWEITLGRGRRSTRSSCAILGEGRPLGVHAVITADRGGAVPTAVAPTSRGASCCAWPTPTSTRCSDAPKDMLDDASAPGPRHRRQARGPDRRAGRHGQRRRADQGARACWRPSSARRACRRWPRSAPCRRGSTASDAAGRTSTVSRSSASPRTRWRRAGSSRSGSFVVTGPPQSGKTNTLQGADHGRWSASTRDVKLFHFGGRRSELARLPRRGCAAPTRPEDEKDLATELADIVADESRRRSDHDRGRGRPAPRGRSGRPRDAGAAAGDLPTASTCSIGDADVVAGRRAGRACWATGRPTGRASRSSRTPTTATRCSRCRSAEVKRTDFPDGRGIFVQAGKAMLTHVPVAEE